MSEGPGEPSFADVVNGIVNGTPRKRGERRGLFRRRRSASDPDVGGDEPVGGEDDTGRIRSVAGRHEWVEPPADDTRTPPWGFEAPVGDDAVDPRYDEHGVADDASSFVRPYAWTGGRTRPVYQLAIETLISLGPQGRDPERIAQYEHRAIAELCREPRSVAEVAALLTLPLGVARVLIGDMASQGTVVVHQTAGTSEAGPNLALMERVLSGLRRL